MIEEFEMYVHDDIKTYLDEQKVENLAKAASPLTSPLLTRIDPLVLLRSLALK